MKASNKEKKNNFKEKKKGKASTKTKKNKKKTMTKRKKMKHVTQANTNTVQQSGVSIKIVACLCEKFKAVD